MKQSFISCTLVLYISFLFSCTQKDLNNHLFDFGSDTSPVKEGFISVTPNMIYDSSVGYGWISDVKDREAFDQMEIKPASELLQDGIVSQDTLTFQIDAQSGDYLLYISVGNQDPLDLSISFNDQLITDSATTPWITLKYRTISKLVNVSDDKAIISLTSNKYDRVSVHGIELRPISMWDDYEMPTLLNQDTSAISVWIENIKLKLSYDPSNTQYINHLNDLYKFKLAAYFYDIGWWSWAVKETGLSIFPRYHIASNLLRQIIADENNPLYDRSVYLIARIHYWLYKEQGNEYNREQYEKYFKLLHDKYPDHPILSMYYGEKIPHESSCQTTDNYAPAWANYQREAICRMKEMTHYWADSVQAVNGEFGGKFGDDVEILRWWLPVILGADDQKSREAYTRLVNGVWNSGLLERAFSKKVEDVEHSAELFRDTHPAMFLMNYGNPIYVERCLISMQNFRDTWTGINSHGHRHFKSCYLSASAVDETPPYAVDVPLNARATLPMLWAAWYNQNPSTISLFNEWGRAWVEDAARDDNGKPAGLMPAAVSYKEDKLGGYAPHWYDPGEELGWEYFDWESLGHVSEMYNQLLGLYAITGQKSLLNPMNATFDFMINNRDTKSITETKPGSDEWAAAQLWGKTSEGLSPNEGIMKLFGSARALVGTTDYDKLIVDAGRHYSQYRVTGDEKYIVEGLEEILNTIRYNYPLFTTEVKFTDRVYIPNDDLLFGMYTGHIGSGFEFPGLSATWSNTGTDVAILMGQSDRIELNAQLYNFGSNKEIGIYTWQLEPGEYELTLRGKENDNFISQKVFEINERTSFTTLEVTSKELIDLKIRQVKPYSGITFPRADLAISEEDIRIDPDWDGQGNIPVDVSIHNIGNKVAQSVIVEIWDGNERMLSNSRISLIEAPNDLNPRVKSVRFRIPLEWQDKEVLIRTAFNEPEITLLNNEVKAILKN
ncbi:MAG: hypothetical protein ACFHWX_08985 [Bacteroidota bacterium]